MKKDICIVKRSYWKHKTVDGKLSFRKSVTCVEREGRQLPVIILQYYYEGGDVVPLVMSPHKNRKHGVQAHTRTQHSTLRELAASTKTPKETFTKTWTGKGGIVEIDSFSDMPRNQRQIYNVRKNIQSKNNSTCNGDAIVDLIAMAKEHESRPDGGLIRDLRVHPDLSCVIASSQQPDDLVRFCTNHVDSTVLGIDSTFNIGKYDVTFTTYNNLLLETRVPDNAGRRHSPICSVQLTYITAKILIHFTTLFPEASGLRFFLHSKRNLKAKISEFNLQPIQAQLLLDIFGKQDDKEVVCGLLDSFDVQEFDERLATLKSKWDQLERNCCQKSSLNTSFHSWFTKYHAAYMVNP